MGIKDSMKETEKGRARKPALPRTKSVSFHLDAPEVTSVALVGGFNNWDPNVRPLRRGKGGVWRGSVRLSPGVYEYKFMVDGAEWWEDPVNPNRVPNAYGTFNSVCEVV